MRRHGSMMVVLSGLLAASLAIGLPVGSAYADEPTDGTGAGTSATEVLDSLEVKGRAPKTGYKRTQFGKAWADVDHNGCDTRNDILNRDLTGVRHKWRTHNCVVKSGKLHDPYTGKDIKFKKGKKTSTAVQIDHVVALSDAWQKGAQKLSEERRTALANDPYNLLAVQGRANQKKSDGDAATWLPSNKGFRCEYVARQIGVKHKYSLWVTQAEKEAMAKVLSSCPTQTVPDYTGGSRIPQPRRPPSPSRPNRRKPNSQLSRPSRLNKRHKHLRPNPLLLRLPRPNQRHSRTSTTRTAPRHEPLAPRLSTRASRATVHNWTATMTESPANKSNTVSPPSGYETYGAEA